MTLHRFLALLAALWLLGLAPMAQAQQAVPVLSDRVIDQAGWLQADQHQALAAQLAALEKDLGTQMVVLIVPTTAPEDIAAYAQRVADSWKIGRRAVGDGLLLVVATQDRKLRIEVAKALEGAIPDLAARRIIDEVITPAFRRGEPAAGLAAAVTRVQALVKGEGLPTPAADAAAASGDRSGGDAIDWAALGMIALVGAPIIARVLTELAGRKLGPLLTAGGVGFIVWNFSASLALAIGAGVLGLIIAVVMGALGSAGVLRQIGRQSSRYGPAAGWGAGAGSGYGGGFGGGSSGGGGFSSGGGGDFGGGGASGGW